MKSMSSQINEFSDVGFMTKFDDLKLSLQYNQPKYSIGVGRDLAKPVFIDEIRRSHEKKNDTPGPGHYQPI